MHRRCKEELARAYLKAIALHEESQKDGFVLARGWAWCCHEATADPELEELVLAIAPIDDTAVGLGHVWEWAHKMLGLDPTKHAGKKDNNPGNYPK